VPLPEIQAVQLFRHSNATRVSSARGPAAIRERSTSEPRSVYTRACVYNPAEICRHVRQHAVPVRISKKKKKIARSQSRVADENLIVCVASISIEIRVYVYERDTRLVTHFSRARRVTNDSEASRSAASRRSARSEHRDVTRIHQRLAAGSLRCMRAIA